MFEARFPNTVLDRMSNVQWRLRDEDITSPDAELGDTRWLVLPFHPSLHCARLNKVLREFASDPILSSLLRGSFGRSDFGVRVRVAWKNVLPKLFEIV